MTRRNKTSGQMNCTLITMRNPLHLMEGGLDEFTYAIALWDAHSRRKIFCARRRNLFSIDLPLSNLPES